MQLWSPRIPTGRSTPSRQPRTRESIRRARGALWLAAVFVAGVAAPTGSRAQSFEALGHPGALGSVPTDVSADGAVVVGFTYSTLDGELDPGGILGFRWEGAALQSLPRCRVSPRVSDDGTTIAASCTAAGGANPPALWVDGVEQPVPLTGRFEGSPVTVVSGDGQVVFGVVGHEIPGPGGLPTESLEAYRSVGGVGQGVGRLSGDLKSSPVAASFAGDAAAIESRLQGFDPGSGEEIDEVHAALWQGGVLQDLGSLGGGDVFPGDISSDGSTVVGQSDDRAFRWTAASGMLDLGSPPGGTLATANAVSGDGAVVVGAYNGAGLGEGRASIWADGSCSVRRVSHATARRSWVSVWTRRPGTSPVGEPHCPESASTGRCATASAWTSTTMA